MLYNSDRLLAQADFLCSSISWQIITLKPETEIELPGAEGEVK